MRTYQAQYPNSFSNIRIAWVWRAFQQAKRQSFAQVGDCGNGVLVPAELAEFRRERARMILALYRHRLQSQGNKISSVETIDVLSGDQLMLSEHRGRGSLM